MTSLTMIEIKTVPFDPEADLRDPSRLTPDMSVLISDIAMAATTSGAALAKAKDTYVIVVPTGNLVEFCGNMQYWLAREAGGAKLERPKAVPTSANDKEILRLRTALTKAEDDIKEWATTSFLSKFVIEQSQLYIKDLQKQVVELKKRLGE